MVHRSRLLEDDVLLVALDTGELGCSLKVPGERLPEAVADVEDFETIDRVEFVFWFDQVCGFGRRRRFHLCHRHNRLGRRWRPCRCRRL